MKYNVLFVYITLAVGIIALSTLILGSPYNLNVSNTYFIPMVMGDENSDTTGDDTAGDDASPQSIEPKGTTNLQFSSLNETHTSNASGNDHNTTSIPMRSIISDEELAKLKERIKNGNFDR